MSFTSWGGLPETGQKRLAVPWADQVSDLLPEAGLAVGCGRSYGDSGLAENGTVLQTEGLNRFLSFDRENGVLRCESGTTLGQILELVVPAGWMLPVLPGTRFVTVAGAIANDIHGKNHDVDGTFGCWVRSFELLRSDGELLVCGEKENTPWFEATIAGLGLTGVILRVELQLQPVVGPWLETQTTRFANLEEFQALCEDSTYEYNAAWIDCLHKNCRGYFSSASHSQKKERVKSAGRLFDIPFRPPFSPINRFSLTAFNWLVYQRQRSRQLRATRSMYSWFFPLDGIGHWNRLYGRMGFRQYQCVVPAVAVPELLAIVRRTGQGSFLAVLKRFGERSSPGLLSFPRPGLTLALDFPWRGQQTETLFAQLDALVSDCGGAVYPAKDAHMSTTLFKSAYPAWATLEHMRDPQLQSRLWARVTAAD